MVKIRPRDRAGLAAVALLGALALAQQWFAERRPAAAESRAVRELVVTSAEDRGEGSLREAAFTAASVGGRARILLRTPRIRLETPLPPLVNPNGTSIEAEGGCEIDLARVAQGPAIEVQGAHSQLLGVALLNSPAEAVRVAARGFRFAAGRVAGNSVGMHVLAEADGLTIEGTAFDENGTGIRIAAAAPGAAIRNNRFSAHREAAIWLVRPEDAPVLASHTLAISGNRFRDDRVSVVLGNAPVAVERNEFVANREVAILMLGAGVAARGNQVRDGAGIGILAQGAPRAMIEGNEVTRNRALGVLVRYSGGSSVQNNRVYGNGYGMAFVLGEAGNPVHVNDNAVMSQQYDGIVVIGDSPVIRHNRTLSNGHAGVRLYDLAVRNSPKVVSTPYLESNTMAGNLLNEIVRGEYRVDGARVTK